MIIITTRSSVSLAIVFIVAFWTGQAQANFSFVHSGSLNPTTEGFTLWPWSSGTATVGLIHEDMGYEAWSIAGLALGQQYAYYSLPLSNSQKEDIARQGVVLSVTQRVVLGAAPIYTPANPAIISVTAVSTGSKRFDIDLGVDSYGDTVVVLPDLIGVSGGAFVTPGATFTLTGSSDSYHTFKLVYHPTTQLADLYVDGVMRIQNYAGVTYSSIEGNSRGVYSTLWGGVNGGKVNFNSVQFTSSPTPIPGDCNDDSSVAIDEVQSAINMYLGLKVSQACVDLDGDGVRIDEVQKVINGYLGL